MSEHRAEHQVKRPFVPRMVRVFAIPIIAFWALLAVSTNTFMPQVERVAEELAGPVVPHYAPSQRALLAIGAKFQESNSTSLAMVVLEANRPLGDVDHQYYDELMRRLLHDTKHVQSAIDLWGKPITAAGAQSLDGKCTYVLLRLAGDIGQMQANQSVAAVRDIVAKDTPPPGLKVYVSGAAPLASDTVAIANSSLNDITIVTIFLIIGMLLLVYRSIVTLFVPLAGVLFEMLVAKGVIATLGHLGYIELSSFAVNIVVALTLGAGTDYGIFLMGRYHEARHDGESREEAFYTAYKSVTPVILGSGLTIAGACYCLTFARLNYFHTMGPAVAISHAVHHRGSADARPGLLDRGQPFRAFRPEKQGQGASVSADRDERGPVAGADPRRPVPPPSCSGRSSCRRTGRTTTTAQYQPRQWPRQPGFRGGGSALPEEQAVLRDADDRVGS